MPLNAISSSFLPFNLPFRRTHTDARPGGDRGRVLAELEVGEKSGRGAG